MILSSGFFLFRWIKAILGTILLLFALALPYRQRVAFSDLFGRCLNAVYQGYLRLLRWFFRQLER